MASSPHSHTVDLVFQAVSIMIPVVTSYLVLFVGAIGALWDMSSRRPVKFNWRMASGTIGTGTFALGLFAGAMHFGIVYSAKQQFLWDARVCLFLGYSVFVLSLILGASTCFEAIRTRK